MNKDADIMETFVPMEQNMVKEFISSFYDIENIEMKTRLKNPKAVTSILLLAKEAESLGLNETAEIIMSFVYNWLPLLISKNGLGREEAIEMSKALSTYQPESLAEKHEASE